jgi:hypothetical protein
MAEDLMHSWMEALAARHLAGLRLPEVTRALRALSSAYVERRQALSRGAALDSAGKRAAFALFYAPIHFLITRHIVTALAAGAPPVIVDLGCGTGAGGAAWATAGGGSARLVGLDRHPWAVAEARWTYRVLGLDGRAQQGDVVRYRFPRANPGIIAAYVLNELRDADRAALVERLLEEARTGSPVLIVEPIARAIAPWWQQVADAFVAAGGRSDEWSAALDLPELVAKLDLAAGLNHRQIKARSIFIARSR